MGAVAAVAVGATPRAAARPRPMVVARTALREWRMWGSSYSSGAVGVVVRDRSLRERKCPADDVTLR